MCIRQNSVLIQIHTKINIHNSVILNMREVNLKDEIFLDE